MTPSLLLISCLLVCVVRAEYQPTWASLDSRPLPSWYDEAKVGIFLHWGVFSVPSFGSAWFWKYWQDDKNQAYVNFMKNNYRPDFTYQDFARDFTAEFYDPEEWARILDASGARYVVLTSKHHEGFTLWPSKGSWGWNAMDVGPKRDLVGDLAAAVRSQAPHIHFGLYHSLYEWFNPFFLHDRDNNFHTNDFVTRKTMPELYELVGNYHPEVVWSDGDGKAQDWYWNSTVFLAWLFNESPVKDTVVVNDRWGLGINCRHGSFYTCKDRYNPGVLQPHKWENCMTLDKKAWVYRRNAPATDYLTIHELLTQLASTISCGGNILINAGPTHDGRIPAIMEERLRQLGWWLGVNGQAVYASKPWTHQNDSLTPGVWYTQQEGTVYAIVLTWPPGDVLVLGSVRPSAIPILFTHISMLGYQGALQFKAVKRGLQVVFPRMSEVDGQWAWVLSMRGVHPATSHLAPVAE